MEDLTEDELFFLQLTDLYKMKSKQVIYGKTYAWFATDEGFTLCKIPERFL